MQNIVEIRDGVTRHPLYRMKHPVNLTIAAGEQVAIVGRNGSGKSRLVDIITGRYPLLMNEVRYDFSPSPMKLVSDNIKYITFRDSYGDNDSSYYYQQRWNQHDIDENTPTVGSMLDEAFAAAENGTGYGMTDEEKRLSHERRALLKEKLYEMFHLSTLLDKYIILLSSGELRKFQLTKTLLSGPRMLIMDTPFIGLDAQTRDQLADLLHVLIRETDLQVVLVLSKTDDIPDFITHVIPVEELDIRPKMTRADYLAQRHAYSAPVLSETKRERILNLIRERRPRFVPAFEQMSFRGNTIAVSVPTAELREEILRSKTGMLMRIAELANIQGSMELEVTVNEEIRAARPIKLEDRVKYMTDKNPLLTEFRKALDLEIE